MKRIKKIIGLIMATSLIFSCIPTSPALLNAAAESGSDTVIKDYVLTWITEPQFTYEAVYSLNFPGMWEVYTTTKREYVDSYGNRIKYDYVPSTLTDKLYKAQVDGKYGVIDVNENVIVPFEYSRISRINDNLFSVTKDGKSGIMNSNGEIVLPIDSAYIFEQGLTDNIIAIRDGHNNKCGAMNINGELIVPCEYQNVRLYDDGYLEVYNSGKRGLYSVDGKCLAKPEYSGVSVLVNSLIRVSIDGKYGVLNPDGNTVLNMEYDQIYSLNNTHFYAEKDDNTYVFDSNGNAFITPEMGYDFISCEFADSTVFFGMKNDKYGFIDLEGNVVIPFEYDELCTYTENIICLYVGETSKYYDLSKREFINVNFAYDDLNFHSDTIVEVNLGGKSGLYDISGKVLIPIEYDYISSIYPTELFNVRKNSKYGVFDINGNAIIPVEYDNLKVIGDTYFRAMKDGKIGAFDMNGKNIIPVKYTNVEQMTEELFVCFDTRGEALFYDIHGHYIDKIDNYEQFVRSTNYAANVVALAVKTRDTNKWGFARIHESGLVHLPLTPAPAIIIPGFTIAINHGEIANSNALYPCIIYNDITYFPMTYTGSRSLGLTADWTAENGLVIEKTETDPFIPEFEQGSAPNISGEAATIATGKITVNGKPINNFEEEYPLLLFRDVTYFPLTWRFAVEEFGWSYSFTPESGLSISCN